MKPYSFLLPALSALIISCSGGDTSVAEDISDDGLLLNDDLVAFRSADGTVSIKNAATGRVTIRDIQLDWTQRSGSDSLAVYCSEGKRGFYNLYTGEIAVPAQFRRAWVFREGLAGVQRNGNIGFINTRGETVIGFRFPYHGNPLTEFVFHDGHCVVADTTGRCGVIDRTGAWLIPPEYDYVGAYKEYAIVTRAGVTMQMAYSGTVLNSFVLDNLKELTFTEQERYVNADGEVRYGDRKVKTGLYAYCVGGRYGLMDADCHRLTEPLYKNIYAVRALLLDYSSEVILNARGEVMR